MVTAVTPHGVRDGEPDALAELCVRRGAAVLAFAEHVAAPGNAGPAAADAFARFRVSVAARPQIDATDADALLLSATRSAALASRARAARPPEEGADERPEECVRCDGLLVRWIEDELPPAASERFEGHVAECDDCSAVLERFEAAERAYQSPPKAPLPRAVARAIVGALAAAAPVTALDGDTARVREAAERLVLGAAPPAAQPPRAAADAQAPAARAPVNGAARSLPRIDIARPSGGRLRAALNERRREKGLPPRPVREPRERSAGPPLLALVTAGIVVGLWLAVRNPPTGGGVAVLVTLLGAALWLAAIWWVHTDATQRIGDPRLVIAATALAAVPIAGPILYLLLRPPEALDDAREREISIAASQKLIEVLVELQRTQLEIHAGVRHLEQGLQSARRRAAARQTASPQ